MKCNVKSLSLTAALIMFFGASVFLLNESNAQGKIYKIGDIGPAGGWIFYINPNPSGGWTYLEAAPADIDKGSKSEWGGTGYLINGTGKAIGTGKINTSKIVKFHDGLSPDYYTNSFNANTAFSNPNCNFSNSNDGTVAAKLCENYTVVYKGTAFDDWFLPSQDELAAMYDNLKMKGLGDFVSGNYWSSSENAKSSAWAVHFGSGGQSFTPKSGEVRVRAVRVF